MAGALMGPRRRGGRRRAGRIAEINVTPFVDVMLVLLIVFMVTAPLLTVGVPVDLPKTAAKQLAADQTPLTVTVTREGAIYLGGGRDDEAVALDALPARLAAIAGTGAGLERRVLLRADTAAAYGNVIQVMAVLSQAGFTNLGLITDPLPPSKGR
jgi:biopolymer transport protein TolR